MSFGTVATTSLADGPTVYFVFVQIQMQISWVGRYIFTLSTAFPSSCFPTKFVELVIFPTCVCCLCAIVLIQTDVVAMSVAHRFAIKLEQCFLSRINTNDQPITFLATESPFLMMRIISTSSLSSHDRHICRHPSWRTVHLALGSVWKHSCLESGLKLTETSEWGRAATN